MSKKEEIRAANKLERLKLKQDLEKTKLELETKMQMAQQMHELREAEQQRETSRQQRQENLAVEANLTQRFQFDSKGRVKAICEHCQRRHDILERIIALAASDEPRKSDKIVWLAQEGLEL